MVLLTMTPLDSPGSEGLQPKFVLILYFNLVSLPFILKGFNRDYQVLVWFK